MKQAKLAEKLTKKIHKSSKGAPEGVTYIQKKDGKKYLSFNSTFIWTRKLKKKSWQLDK